MEKKLFLEISKKADFHSAVMTTFSFDFHHFESQVLKQLKKNGVTNVSLFADSNMLDESIGLATGHLKSLGSNYSINSIPSKGAFHPKLTLLASDKEVLLLQGSGNITSGGHGKNHEIFSALYATNENQTQLPLILEAWEYIKTLTANVKGLSSDKLDWITRNSTLLQKKSDQKHRFHKIEEDFEAALLYNEKTGIWQQIKDKIQDETILHIKIISPFYDENGALLLAMSTHFNDCPIEVYLQEDKGIHPFKMEKRKNISFYNWDTTKRADVTFKTYKRKLHAKIMLFQTSERYYCLLGSANATTAAFGSDTGRGSNDEFSVLFKVKNRNLIEELELNGSKTKIEPKENKTSIEVESEESKTAVNRTHVIKIMGADREGKNITLHLNNFENYKTGIVVVYDFWGNEIEQIPIKIKSNKVKIMLSGNSHNNVGYLAICNEENNCISNKQLINNVQQLWNTNPSPENRKIMRLTSLIENAQGSLFDVIDYFNTIHSNRNTETVSVSNSSGSSNEDQDDEVKNEVVLTYEEAIALDRSNATHSRIIKQHHTIKIWDAIEKYLRQLTQDAEEESMDDEEQSEADAVKSRERKDSDTTEKTEELNSVKVLEKRRNEISKFLFNYSTALVKAEEIENNKIGLIDLAMFLIVMKQLHEVTHRTFTLRIESEEPLGNNFIFDTLGNVSYLDNFPGAILNLIGQFTNVGLNSKFETPEDEYTAKKLEHYKNSSCITSLFSLAIVKSNYKNEPRFKDWIDVTALNVLTVLGIPSENYEAIIKELIKTSNIKTLNTGELMNIINRWLEIFQSKEFPGNYMEVETVGMCIIKKFIPSAENPKFVKLGRPGFDYDEKEHDFIIPELFNLETATWIKSKNSINK